MLVQSFALRLLISFGTSRTRKRRRPHFNPTAIVAAAVGNSTNTSGVLGPKRCCAKLLRRLVWRPFQTTEESLLERVLGGGRLRTTAWRLKSSIQPDDARKISVAQRRHREVTLTKRV
jgi:hypothetical protein